MVPGGAGRSGPPCGPARCLCVRARQSPGSKGCLQTEPQGKVMNSFPVEALRREFPALHRVVDGRPPIFLDGPGGTQVPQRVIDAMVRYLTTCNANHGGDFTTSRESDAILADAHQAAADLLNAPSADEIVFG